MTSEELTIQYIPGKEMPTIPRDVSGQAELELQLHAFDAHDLFKDFNILDEITPGYGANIDETIDES